MKYINKGNMRFQGKRKQALSFETVDQSTFAFTNESLLPLPLHLKSTIISCENAARKETHSSEPEGKTVCIDPWPNVTRPTKVFTRGRKR